MGISLVTYASQTVTPQDDALIYEAALKENGMIYGGAVTLSSANVLHVAAGHGAICGRKFTIEATDISVALTSSGTLNGRLYIHMDLSDTDEPISLEVETASTLTDEVQEENVNITNGVYEIRLAEFTVDTSTISNLTDVTPFIDSAAFQVADGYDNTSTYLVGEYVLYQTTLYRCIEAITTAEDFDESKWEATTVAEELYGRYEVDVTCVSISGETVTLTCGDETHSKTVSSDDEVLVFRVHTKGTWTITNSATSGSASLTLDDFGVYTATTGYAQIICTLDNEAFVGATLTCTDGTTTYTATVDSTLTATFVVDLGTWTISNTLTSKTYSVECTDYTDYALTINYYTLYGFRKTKATTDPEDRITYLSDCDNADFTAAYMDYTNSAFNYGSWEDAWFMPKPCLLAQDGTVYCYLNPDDYTLDTDGNDVSSYLTGSSGTYNAMMQWPKIYVKREDDGTYEDTYICDQQLDSDYHCYSNIDANGNEIDYFYTRIYEGSNVSSVLRSISGKTPINTVTGTNEITYATANNQNSAVEWYTGTWADRCLINDLLTLISKSTDHQTAFGNGHYTGGSSASNLLATGTMNAKGLFYGTKL